MTQKSYHAEPHRRRKRIIDMASAVALFCAVMLDAVIWQRILIGWAGVSRRAGIYFLDVAQGESALAILPGGITALDDAGADDTAVAALAKVLPQSARRIDLAFISYPAEGNWGGYSFLIDHYAVGAFVYNGRNDAANKTDWQAFMAKIAAKRIPIVTVGAGDRIRCGAGCAISVLSPDKDFVRSAELRDTAVVLRVAISSSLAQGQTALSALLPSDVGMNAIRRMATNGYDMRANVLKAPFPALASATSALALAFLRTVAPKIVVIAPGIKGTPGVPPGTAAGWIAFSTNARVIRIAASGTVGIVPQNGGFLLYNE